MNIVDVLNELKEAKMVSTTEEGLTLFSDCFNKFGISILLLKDKEQFSTILNTLVENKIPLQKANGIYNLRVFALEEDDLKNTIEKFSSIEEINFLRRHPEMLTESVSVKKVLKNMKKCKEKNLSYKNGKDYNLELLLADANSDTITKAANSNAVNDYLKTVLVDKLLVDKVEKNIANEGEEDLNIALELQKVENKICEEFLVPADDGWKIVIEDKEINSFQDIKDTINTIIKLNIPITSSDALIFVLFYKTSLSVSEVEKIIKNHFSEGGM